MTAQSWSRIDLYGAARIARVCNVYEITEVKKVPGTRFRIKVLEDGEGYTAHLNVCLKAADGSVDGMIGLGRTEVEALQDALRWFMLELDKRSNPSEDDFEWSDPRDF